MESQFPHGLMPASRPVIRDRLTVVEKIYHQPSMGGETFLSETGFHRDLDTYEQVYERRHLSVEEDWIELSFGWVKSVGMLVILNEEGLFLRSNPSEDDRFTTKKKVLEICCPPLDSRRSWLIPAGETGRFIPSSPSGVFIRSQFGKSCYTLRVFPA